MAYVYGLSDPRTDELHYVGKTECKLGVRLSGHVSIKETRKNTWKNRWIRSLLDQGLRPEIWAIEEISAEQIEEAEAFWIEYFTYIGAELYNCLPGGARLWVGDRKFTERTVARMSVSQRARWARIKRGEERLPTARLRRRVVDSLGRIYDGIAVAERALGIAHGSIGRHLAGGRPSVKGLTFRYLDPPRNLPSQGE